MTLLLLLFVAITADQIVLIISPLIVYGGTELVKLLKLKLNPIILLAVVVPALSALLAWLVTAISPEASFWAQLAVGVLAVFVAEVVQALKTLNNPITEANKTIAKAEVIKTEAIAEGKTS